MTTSTKVQMSLDDNMTSTCDDKIERKMVEGHKFAGVKHETLHLLQWR
jgi:hypothetical protein